jgi:glutathione S-transferase
MKLIGRNNSPYGRRIAVSMTMLGIKHEREYLALAGNPQAGFAYNPIGRVPALVLDDGESLIESGAILDYVDSLAPSAKRLIPAKGKARRDCLQVMGIATGVAEKAIAAAYEVRQRPPEKVHEPYRQHLLAQAAGGLKALEARAYKPWVLGKKMTQADITLAVVVTYLRTRMPELVPAKDYPRLTAHADACEALPAFKAHPLEKA